MKKVLSIILSMSMLVSASAVGVSAIIEPTGEYAPDTDVETNRYYFYMPDEWYNEYTESLGVYWWEGTDACGSFDGSGGDVRWPGYKAKESEEKGIFYIDCPKNVPNLVCNNYVDGGEDKYLDIYYKAYNSIDINTEFYSNGDSDTYSTEFFEYMEESFYGDKSALSVYADNFFIEKEYGLGLSFNMDNMIYVIDPSKTTADVAVGKIPYVGEWYFYYGNGEYGTYPLKEDAVRYGTVDVIGNINAPTVDVNRPVELPEGDNWIHFDVKASGWGNVKTMFCHIWRADGTGEAHAWQSKKEKCVYDSATGIASYDLTKLNFPVTPEDGREFCVIFSANTGMQTYNTIMSGSCIGDTMYCSGIEIENPEDSEKKAMTAVWKNNPDCGPERKITSTGNIVGTAYPDGVTDATLLASFLIQYYNDPAKTELTEQLLKELNVSPVDVMAEVENRVGSDDPDGKLPVIEKILAQFDTPSYDPSKPIVCDVNGDGFTNIIDATLIQKYAVELEPFTTTQVRISDLNSDGVVNVMDSTVLQKYLAGIL